MTGAHRAVILTATALLGGALLGGAQLAGSGPGAGPAFADSATFSYGGAGQRHVVPAGVSAGVIEASDAGGSGSPHEGFNGGGTQKSGGATVAGASASAALTPVFGAVTATADGFTAKVSNYNKDYTWTASATDGSASIDGKGLVTVTGLAPDTSSTVTVTTKRTGYSDGSATKTGTSLKAALVPQFGPVKGQKDGFSVAVTNFDNNYNWPATASNGRAIGGSGGGFQVIELGAGESSTLTVTATRKGYATGTGTTTGTSLMAALTPGFGEVSATAAGFTVPVTNYSKDYTWAVTATAGSASIGGGLVTVTGLAPDTSSKVTVWATRDGYMPGKADVAGTSLKAALLVPAFGPVSATAAGFTVPVTNYSKDYTWTASATDGSASIGTAGLVTVTGLAADSSSTVTVTASRAGYAPGTGTVAGTSLLAALIPRFGPATSTAAGFTLAVGNYSDAWTWAVTATAGSAAIDAGLVTVTGLGADTSSTVTVTATRTGYADGTGTVAGTSLKDALIPQFGPVTGTADGFTVQVTDYDTAWTWSMTDTAGIATLENSGRITVTGLAPDTWSTITVSTARDGYVTGSADIGGRSLLAALTPQFGDVTSTVAGFTVPVTNYSGDWTWAVSATDGSASIDGGLVTVTKLKANTSSTVTVTTTRAGYATGSGTKTGTSLMAALVPRFWEPVAKAAGFTVLVSNYSDDWTWEVSASAGSAAIDAGVVTVTGLGADSSSTVTVTAARAGYAPGTGTVAGTSLMAALVPGFGPVSATAAGFTVPVSDYSGDWTWAVSATAGSVSIDSGGLVTVTGLGAGTSSTVTVTATRSGHADGSAQVAGTSLKAALVPEFGPVTGTADGFTVPVSDYDPAWTWTLSDTTGIAAIGDTGVVTVTGLAPGTSSKVTVTATRDGYVTGSANVAGTSVLAALVPAFGPVSATAAGFTVPVTNYSKDYTWTASATAGSVSIDGTGLVTVTGLGADSSSTVTVRTTRAGYATGSAELTGTSAPVPVPPAPAPIPEPVPPVPTSTASSPVNAVSVDVKLSGLPMQVVPGQRVRFRVVVSADAQGGGRPGTAPDVNGTAVVRANFAPLCTATITHGIGQCTAGVEGSGPVWFTATFIGTEGTASLRAAGLGFVLEGVYRVAISQASLRRAGARSAKLTLLGRSVSAKRLVSIWMRKGTRPVKLGTVRPRRDRSWKFTRKISVTSVTVWASDSSYSGGKIMLRAAP